jgi:hypothetical protein
VGMSVKLRGTRGTCALLARVPGSRGGWVEVFSSLVQGPDRVERRDDGSRSP